jgi:hypothetical protein
VRLCQVTCSASGAWGSSRRLASGCSSAAVSEAGGGSRGGEATGSRKASRSSSSAGGRHPSCPLSSASSSRCTVAIANLRSRRRNWKQRNVTLWARPDVADWCAHGGRRPASKSQMSTSLPLNARVGSRVRT